MTLDDVQLILWSDRMVTGEVHRVLQLGELENQHPRAVSRTI